jgi:hypothetical protein
MQAHTRNPQLTTSATLGDLESRGMQRRRLRQGGLDVLAAPGRVGDQLGCRFASADSVRAERLRPSWRDAGSAMPNRCL